MIKGNLKNEPDSDSIDLLEHEDITKNAFLADLELIIFLYMDYATFNMEE